MFNFPLSFCMLYVFLLNRRLQSNYICFTRSSKEVFFFKNNMTIQMLWTVQGDIVQQRATKLNDWFRLKNVKYYIPRVSIYVHFLFSISLKSSTCMSQKLQVHYAYLNLSKHKRIWVKKQNSIPLCVYVVLLNNPLQIIVAFCF